MIHKACMPVYMNSGKIVADGRDGTGKSKVLQEVLADLKRAMSFLALPVWGALSCTHFPELFGAFFGQGRVCIL